MAEPRNDDRLREAAQKSNGRQRLGLSDSSSRCLRRCLRSKYEQRQHGNPQMERIARQSWLYQQLVRSYDAQNPLVPLMNKNQIDLRSPLKAEVSTLTRPTEIENQKPRVRHEPDDIAHQRNAFIVRDQRRLKDDDVCRIQDRAASGQDFDFRPLRVQFDQVELP